MRLIGKKQGSKFELSPALATLKREFWAKLKDGTLVSEELKVYRPLKSQQQLGAYFGLLIQSAIEQVDDMGLDTSGFLKLMMSEELPTGIPLTKEILYELLLCFCPVYDDEHKKLSLSKMDTKQASDYFELCRNFLASRGIYISDPDPFFREKEKTDLER